MNIHPNITITSRDAARLETLLEGMPAGSFPGHKALEDEIYRATLVAPEEIPPTVVTMNSTVRFAVLPSGVEHRLKLVYPGKTDASDDTVSILAPVGSALLGLAEGDEIHWPNPNGGTLHIVVHKVEDQPERAGCYDQ
ncbi:MAG: nucleoside diphosphate kinase regulator [Deltaproteobacteria bacterium]|nr:nucleoside diphosphate kinase regulator [Deltaproteobacteria bacterium]